MIKTEINTITTKESLHTYLFIEFKGISDENEVSSR